MKPREIQARMVLKGVTQRQIAQRLGVSGAAVSLCVNGLSRSRRIQEAVAEAVDMPYDKVWRS